MFVLRAQCKLSDATGEFGLYGLAGSAAQQYLGADAAPWSLKHEGQASVLALYPAAGNDRALWIAPQDSAPKAKR